MLHCGAKYRVMRNWGYELAWHLYKLYGALQGNPYKSMTVSSLHILITIPVVVCYNIEIGHPVFDRTNPLPYMNTTTVA